MSTAATSMDLPEADIRAQYPRALSLLDGFDYTPEIAHPEESSAPRSPGLGQRRRFRSTTPGLAAARPSSRTRVCLTERLAEAQQDALPTQTETALLRGLRRALAVSLAMAELFAESSALADMKRQNAKSPLSEAKKEKFSNLLTAEALIAAQCFAATFLHLTQPLEAETLEPPEAEELVLKNAQTALWGILWDIDRQIATHGGPDARLVASMRGYAEALIEKLALRSASTPEVKAFAAASYRIEADELTLQGFSAPRAQAARSLTMQFRAPHEVVGNHIAKYQAMRLAKMLMAYDFERRLNPFAELGGFIFTFMGDGKPGTGKTTLIQMMAGLLHGYCETAGYPFRYANLSTESIDSYQGKSAQNAKAFVSSILDPTVIGFGTVDDIDQLAGKRGDRQSSAGQLEITAVLMESFAGANTVVRGNCTFGMFSNYPEKVDDALRQRAAARFLIDGPQSRDDYIDILDLLLGNAHDIPLGDHDPFAAQELQRAVAKSYDAHSRPQEDALATLFDRLSDQIGPLDTIAKLGHYLKEIQVADPRFTGRAIKNITDAVKVRSMEFELPDDWVEEPDLFLRQSYDTKKNMIADLRRPITAEMVLQEINRYADSEFRYADSSDEAAIEQAVRDMQRHAQAKQRFLQDRQT